MEARALDPGLAGEAAALLRKLGVQSQTFERGSMTTRSPITGEIIARVDGVDFGGRAWRHC